MDFNLSIDIILSNFNKLKNYTPVLENISKEWIKALENDHKIMFCGNGGSASDSQHLAAELVGRYKINRPPLAGLSLNTDTSAITAIANDFGYDEIFVKQVQGLGRTGDVLVGLSTSGNSQNIVKAFQEAKEKGMVCIAFTGFSGGKLREIADICLNVPAEITNNIQELHIACGHMICEYVESYFFKECV